MSDINLSNTLWTVFISGVISEFLVGFIPAFYLSYLFFTKTVKKPNYYFVLFYFIIGIFFGCFSYSISDKVSNFLWSHNKIIGGFGVFVIVFGEILIVAMHFFYFEKRKKKK